MNKVVYYKLKKHIVATVKVTKFLQMFVMS